MSGKVLDVDLNGKGEVTWVEVSVGSFGLRFRFDKNGKPIKTGFCDYVHDRLVVRSQPSKAQISEAIRVATGLFQDRKKRSAAKSVQIQLFPTRG